MEFNNVKEIKDCEELQKLGKYEHTRVMLNGEEVIVCGTDMAYEDQIWSRSYLLISELSKRFELDVCLTDFATDMRDSVLSLLENYGVTFVDVFDEY